MPNAETSHMLALSSQVLGSFLHAAQFAAAKLWLQTATSQLESLLSVMRHAIQFYSDLEKMDPKKTDGMMEFVEKCLGLSSFMVSYCPAINIMGGKITPNTIISTMTALDCRPQRPTSDEQIPAASQVIYKYDQSHNSVVQAPALKAFLFPFTLSSNPQLIHNQMMFARLHQKENENYLVMNSIYYSKQQLEQINKLLRESTNPDCFDTVWQNKELRGKNVLVVAKVAQNFKNALIVYGYCLETPGHVILESEALILKNSASSGGNNICYLVRVWDPEENSHFLQLFNSSTKKSRILGKYKLPPALNSSLFQASLLNKGADVLLLVKTAKNKLRLVLGPADATTLHQTYQKATSIELSHTIDDENADIVTFRLCAQTCLDNIVVRSRQIAADQQTEIAEKISAPNTVGYSSVAACPPARAGLPLVCLVRTAASEVVWDTGNNWDLYRVRLSYLSFESISEGSDTRTILSEKVEPFIELPSLAHISSTISSQLKLTADISTLEPSALSFCSKFGIAFIFGRGQAIKEQECLPFLFILSVSTSNQANFKIQAILQTNNRRTEDLCQSMDAKFDNWMPPVAPRFMIAENPALRTNGNLMGVGQGKHPLFIVGVQNDDSLFAVFYQQIPRPGKPGQYEETLEIKDAKQYFEATSPDKTLVKKPYNHVTSISWVETPHGAKFTMASNRYSVTTFGLDSSLKG